MELDNEKVAEQLDEIAEAFMALAGAFRPSSGGRKGAKGNGKTGKAVPAAKSSASKSKKAKDEEEDEVTQDDLQTALKDLANAKGKDKVTEALEEVGAGKLSDVDESQYGELSEKIKELMEAEDEEADADEEVTLKDLQAAAKKLLKTDEAAAKKILKKFKLAKFSDADEDDYATVKAAIDEALDE